MEGFILSKAVSFYLFKRLKSKIMKSEECRKQEFVDTLNVMTIDEDVHPETKQIVEKTYPFSMAIRILLNETEEGRVLKSEREEGIVNRDDFLKRLLKKKKKYRHLVVYYDYE